VEFQVAKLLYLKEKVKLGIAEGNPFAFVTEAQIESNLLDGIRGSHRKKAKARYDLKKQLLLRLLQHGYSEGYIESLVIFLDWMLQLPKTLEYRLSDEIEEITGEEYMSYVTSWERRGIRKGKREGLRKGRLEEKKEVLIHQISTKFSITDPESNTIRTCEDLQKLDAALDAILFAETKEEVLKELR
jgi:hypothetical protein